MMIQYTVKVSIFENIESVVQGSPFEFYDPEAPIYTSPRGLEPSKLIDCSISESIISHGCKLEKCTVQNAVVGLRSTIGAGCTIKDAMIMGSDYYESAVDQATKMANGHPPIGMCHLNTQKLLYLLVRKPQHCG